MTIKLDWVDSYDLALETIDTHKHDVYLVDYRLDIIQVLISYRKLFEEAAGHP